MTMQAYLESEILIAAEEAALQREFDHVKFLQSVETDRLVVLNYGHELELLAADMQNVAFSIIGHDDRDDLYDDPWESEDDWE